MSAIDKRGAAFAVKSYQAEDYPLLVQMYDAFSPKGRFQGMPPRDKTAAVKWIDGLVKSGVNFLAWRHEKVIGHVVIMPDEKRNDAEYLIFVSKVERGLGVGNALTAAVIDEARRMGLDAVWLTVDAYNFRGIRLYRKFGFEFQEQFSSSSERLMVLKPKRKTALTVGVVRDDRYLEHKTGHIHPEHPKRLKTVYKMLDADFPDRLVLIRPELAPLEHLELVHTPGYIDRVLTTAHKDFTSLAPDTPACSRSYLAACLAAGGCISGLDAAVSKRCDVCLALVRPPGHHASPNLGGGFCIFNSIGVAAKYALSRHGFNRILIIDWDIHHGNGLQELFYKDDRVLYFSTHDSRLFPYTGDWEETGAGKGAGFTVNIPLPRDVSDADVFFLYQGLLVPAAERFMPELVLVSAGFDAHGDDPIGRSRLTENAYAWLTSVVLRVREVAGGVPVLFTLEGGYNARALSASVKAVLEVLLGESKLAPPPDGGSERADALLRKAKEIHSRFGVLNI